METLPPPEPLEEVASYITMLGSCEQWWLTDDTAEYPIWGDEMLGSEF